MGVRFVIGRAGSGKSFYCFRAIVEMMKADPLGPPIYWIVPKQETFITERLLTCTSGLDAFCRARVLSFDLLGEEILAECGGTAIPQVTERGRQMVIGHLLRVHADQLGYYKSSARQIGLAAQLAATFAEMERCGRSVREVAELFETLQTTGPTTPLGAKFSDLRFLYERYSEFLGQERLDPHRRLTQVLASLQDCKRVRGACVFADGFLEYTDYERQMLTGLAKVCSDVQITLLLDPQSPVVKDVHALPDEMSPFHRTEDTYRRLWFTLNQAQITLQEPLKLERIERFQNPSLRQIEEVFFVARPVPSGTADGVRLIEATNRRAEVDAAARHIRQLLADGLRLREIAVLMRNLDDYEELISASFTEHQIAYFVDHRQTAAHHPLVQVVRSILQISLHQWPHEAVMTLLKTGLAGITPDSADELENHVLLHRIRGPIWMDDNPWTFARKLTRGHEDELAPAQRVETERIDAMRRRIADPIKPLAQLLVSNTALTVQKMVVELFNVLKRFDVRATLRRWMDEAQESGHLEERSEHEQVWAEFIKLLDQVVDLLGEQQVAPAHFVDIMETGLEEFGLALTPPTADQVIVGSVDRTRPKLNPAAVIVLGMNDSQFPRVPRENVIISDADRRTLRDHRLDLDYDAQRDLLDERLLGYIAMTRASRHLCLTRAIADDQARPEAPSPFWTRIREQFPTLCPTEIPRDSDSALDCIGTPRQLVTALMRWARSGHAEPEPEDPWPGLYHWLTTHDCSNDALDTMRYRAWRALSYANQSVLSRRTAGEMFSSPLKASVSQIETFATCPFKHFIRYGLKLAEREDDEVTPIDLGIVYHGILEKIVRQMLARKAGWELPSAEMIGQIAADVGRELRGELMLSSARNQYILQLIEKTIAQVIAAQGAAASRGKLQPWRAELPFGEGTNLGALAIRTASGNEVRLQGKIDRVDLSSKEGAFAVVDYKYRGSTLALDYVYHGLSLQLLTYLLVLQMNGAKLAGRKLTPVAALYVQLIRQLKKIAHPADAKQPEDPTFNLAIKPRGIINAKYRQAIDSEHVSNASEVVSLHVKTDGSLGKRNSTDACESEEFAAMLRLAERKLGELADAIISGQIDVAPYRIGQASPCEYCEYRPICRFDSAMNRYHVLTPMKREEVLQRAVEEAGK